jgi:hypothetical protein
MVKGRTKTRYVTQQISGEDLYVVLLPKELCNLPIIQANLAKYKEEVKAKPGFVLFKAGANIK